MRNPFIAGSWVRGDNFFGRAHLLREILDGSRDSLWVIGARRMGKTSLLKEIEARTQQSKETPYLALYWDLQGSSDARGLADGLIASIEDNEHFRRAADIDVDAIEDLSVTDMLQAVIRRAVRSGWKTLILMDEGEELLTVARNDVATLGRLRRVLQKGPEVRAIITATRRLARLDEAASLVTSPFLHGFLPPSYLTPLEFEETSALLGRGGFTEAAINAIAEKTGNQPFLVQLIASRLFENKDLEGTLDVVANDDMVSNFFSVDFQTLESIERRILEEVARERSLVPGDIGAALSAPADTLGPHLLGLAQMGYLKQAGGRYGIGNWFFETWLRRQALARGPASERPGAEEGALMVTGANRVFEHAGREFHIQVEDLTSGDTVEVRVYDKGAVLFVKRIPYAEAIAGAPSREDAIRAFMEKAIQTVSAAIVKGKIT